MEKKTYICPAVTQVEVAVVGLIAQSFTSNLNGTGYGGNASESSEPLTPEVKENSYNVWDNDWSVWE